MIDYAGLPFNFSMLLKEIESRAIELSYLGDTDVIEARLGSHSEYLIDYMTRLTPSVYEKIFRDKYYSKIFLKTKGISVPEGYVFSATDRQLAVDYVNFIGFPVVIKPTNASQGHYVFANLHDEEEFLHAFDVISGYSSSRSLLVEQHFTGDDYRFLVIGDEEMAVVRRSPPKIVGDGQLTIRQLVELENQRRMNPRDTCLCTIKIDDEESKRVLFKQGLSDQSILDSGQIVQLRNNANVSGGGGCENALELVHPSYLELARSIHAFFPGNGFTCVDLLIKDASMPVAPTSYAFCEFNADPGFSLHEMPGKGERHAVVRPIVDLLFPETAVKKV
jgi:D-alanine-D-alanine ligase-like ATP-grasp enzyme